MIVVLQPVYVQTSESEKKDIETMQTHMNALQSELSELRLLQAHSKANREQHTEKMEPPREDFLTCSIPSETSTLQDLLSASAQHDHTSPSTPVNETQDEKQVCGSEQKSIQDYIKENERLKEVVSLMREELEKLQDSNIASFGFARLQAELKASDVDLEQANEHINVLEKQIQGRNRAHYENQELAFLRAKVGSARGRISKHTRHIVHVNVIDNLCLLILVEGEQDTEPEPTPTNT